jgi:hydrogenase maturation protein HypF
MWQALVADLRAHATPAQIATRFHHTIAAVILHYSKGARSQRGLETVALTGGVFQNVYLLQTSRELLENDGFRVLTHRLVPPNDGGIALGQAAAASSALP